LTLGLGVPEKDSLDGCLIFHCTTRQAVCSILFIYAVGQHKFM